MGNLKRVAFYYSAGRFFIPLPEYFCFNSTLRCDHHCIHCGIWEDKLEGEELDAGMLAEVLDQPFFKNIHTAWLTGGEPTLRSDVLKLAEVMNLHLPCLRTLGLATNGIRTDRVISTAQDMLKAIDPAQKNLFIHISLDGYGDVHDRIRNKSGAFEGVLGTLDRINELKKQGKKISAGLNCVIQPENVNDLANIYRFAKERDLTVTFNPVVITDQIYRTSKHADKLKLDDVAKQKIISFLESIIPEVQPVLQYQYLIITEVLKGNKRPRRCLTLYSTINLNANGVLIPCPSASDIFPVNACGKDLNHVWKSSEAIEMRLRVEKEFCPSCMLSCSVGDAMSIIEWLHGGWDF